MNLTPSQERAFNFLDKFCGSPISSDQNENEVILTGSPGYGKSFLIDYLKKKHKNIEITATTNKAADIIDGVTIYSLLGLKLKDNYKTGESDIDYENARNLYNEIVVIDECSMINQELFVAIHTYMKKCKIIYVGDYYQLPPVKNENFSIFNIGLTLLELTEPCRTDKSDILNLMNILKDCIKQNVLYKNLVPSENINFITDPKDLETHLINFEPIIDKCLSFTNKNVENQNFLIRDLHLLDHKFGVNDYVVCKSAVPTIINGYKMLSKIESVMKITSISKTDSNGCARIQCDNGGSYKVFLTPFTYTKRLNELADIAKKAVNPKERREKWKEFFNFKNSILDIRDIYASTVHSAQGSTYRNVYIDLRDLWTCPNKRELQRLLYVAVSRAKENVYFILLK